MQGLWARKTRVNLNSALSTPGSAPAAGLQSLAPSRPPSSQSREKSVPPPDPSVDSSTAMTEPPAPIASSSTTTVNVPSSDAQTNGKRKSRTAESSSKRYKSSSSAADGLNRGGGSSSKEKDYSPPSARLADVGGVESCVEKILELVAMPITHPEVYIHTGVQPPRGVLLHGPPGCGKTLLANAIAGVGPFA